MIVSQSAGAVQGSFNDLWYTVSQYLPAILAAVIVFVIGWIIAVTLCRVVVEVVRVLRIDDALKSAGMNDAAKSAGFGLDIGRFLGTLVQWFVILVFLVASLEILGLTRVTVFLQTVVLLYLPQVIVAALILILTAIVAEVVRGLVAGSARGPGGGCSWRQSRRVGRQVGDLDHWHPGCAQPARRSDGIRPDALHGLRGSGIARFRSRLRFGRKGSGGSHHRAHSRRNRTQPLTVRLCFWKRPAFGGP